MRHAGLAGQGRAGQGLARQWRAHAKNGKMTAGQCTPSLWCNIIVRDTSTAFFRTSGQTRPNQTHNPCGRSGAPPSFGRLSGFVTLTPFLSNGLGSDRVPVNVWLSMRSIPPGGSGHSCQKGCPGLYNGAAAPGASSTSERAGSCSGRMLNPKQQGANEHHMKEGNQYGPAGRRLLRRADMASAVGCYEGNERAVRAVLCAVCARCARFGARCFINPPFFHLVTAGCKHHSPTSISRACGRAAGSKIRRMGSLSARDLRPAKGNQASGVRFGIIRHGINVGHVPHF